MKKALALIITLLATVAFAGCATDTSTSSTTPAPAQTTASVEALMVDWAGQEQSKVERSSEEMDNVIMYSGQGDWIGTKTSMRLCATALQSVTTSPDGGEVSGMMHQAGDYYEAAVDAMDSGDFDMVTVYMDMGNSELVKATAELSKYTM
ncbi:MAG TPA: hypothetical protein PLQ14_07420 [Actinomycetota bacterium]|nr:hypothetical protein [Actinomycetota bacterium]